MGVCSIMPPVSDVPAPSPWPCSSALFTFGGQTGLEYFPAPRDFYTVESTAWTTPGVQLLRLFWAAAELELMGNYI